MLGRRELCILVVNFNTRHLLDEMLAALKQDPAFDSARLVLVDNASTDGSAEYLKSAFSEHTLLFSESNIGFGRANNLALDRVDSEFVLLLNTDAFIAPDSLTRSLAYMRSDPKCGVLGVKLVSRDGSLQPSCRYFPAPLNMFLSRSGLSRFLPWVRGVDDMNWAHDEVRECDWVPGCFYLIRRELIDLLGLFDPRYFLYYEEVDHCRAVKAAGWKVVYFPGTSVVHIGGESAKSAGELTQSGRQISILQVESELLFIRKHHGLVGLCLHLILSALSALWVGVKGVLRGKGSRRFIEELGALRLAWRLVRQTAWGTRPTR